MNPIAAPHWTRSAQSPARTSDLQGSRSPASSDFMQQLAAAGEELAAPMRSHGPMAADNAGKGRSAPQAEGAPAWYGQFGDMTRFVPAEYRSVGYQMPTLPTQPERPAKDFGLLTSHGMSKNAALSSFKADRAHYREENLAYRTAMTNLRNTLNANFATLPADVQQKALAARDAWLQTHPAAAAKAAAV